METLGQRMWFKHPAKNWNEALPIGNGKLGAMVYGGMDVEEFALNEDTFWAGYPYDKTKNIDSRWLKDARAALRQGRLCDAENLTHTYMQGEEFLISLIS